MADSRSYTDGLYQRLLNIEAMNAYLSAALQEGDDAFNKALVNVLVARGAMHRITPAWVDEVALLLARDFVKFHPGATPVSNAYLTARLQVGIIETVLAAIKTTDAALEAANKRIAEMEAKVHG